jgi:hypothetical protein
VLHSVNDLKNGDVVIVDFHPYKEVRVIQSPYNNFFVKCKITHDNGEVEEKDFTPECLSLVLTLDIEANKHLILLKSLLNDILNVSDYIVIHYYPNMENKFLSYCFDTVTIRDKDFPNNGSITCGSDAGIGMHIHWLKMWHEKEVDSFLPKRFFDGDGIRLRRIVNTNTFSMEYTGY